MFSDGAVAGDSPGVISAGQVLGASNREVAPVVGAGDLVDRGALAAIVSPDVHLT